MKSDLTDVKVIFVHRTERGLGVWRHEDDREVVWLPLRAVEIDPEEPRRGDIITVTLSEKLAIEKELV